MHTELRDRDSVPRSQKNYIRLENFIFEGCSESSSGTLDRLLDLTTDAGHRTQGTALEFRDFENTVEHSFDECRFALDLHRSSRQFELFDDLRCFVDLNDDASGANPEVGLFLNGVLYGDEAGVLWRDRPPKRRVAMHVHWCVLEEPLTHVVVDCEEQGSRLEPSPAKRQDHGISAFQKFLEPAMFLHPDLDVTNAVLRRIQTSEDHRIRSIEVLDELAGHLTEFNSNVHARPKSLVEDPSVIVQISELAFIQLKSESWRSLDHAIQLTPSDTA